MQMSNRLQISVPVCFVLALFSGFIAGSSAFAESIESKNIEYGTSEKFEGYLAVPKNGPKSAKTGVKGPRPAILVIHNWLGLTAETKKQADRLAGLGYVVIAADIYGKGQRPKDVTEAGQFATKYKTDRKLYRQRLNLALERLLEEKNVDKNRVAAAGYCFGGTGAIELARSGANLVGVISFHGGLDSPTPTDGQFIKAKILVHHGALDRFVSDKDMAAFEAEMKTYKIDYQLVKYSGAVHSFTEKAAGDDIEKGIAYNEAADRRSFLLTESFLKEIF